jgi:hypothetical protein
MAVGLREQASVARRFGMPFFFAENGSWMATGWRIRILRRSLFKPREFTWHSQMVMTLQPDLRKRTPVRMSRRRFAMSFFAQKDLLDFGITAFLHLA